MVFYKGAELDDTYSINVDHDLYFMRKMRNQSHQNVDISNEYRRCNGMKGRGFFQSPKRLVYSAHLFTFSAITFLDQIFHRQTRHEYI